MLLLDAFIESTAYKFKFPIKGHSITVELRLCDRNVNVRLNKLLPVEFTCLPYDNHTTPQAFIKSSSYLFRKTFSRRDARLLKIISYNF